ncbi:MAG: PIN domain-containing protein [Pseudomonadota bacterium]|nr:PIN domain-containing protein [Pseudomonadota bacterium]
MQGDLLDVNVWLALAIEEHPHHRIAAAYWAREAGTARFFCRVSAMSLVRLLSHPRLMGNKPLTLTKAWALYRRFSALPGVAMLVEPDGLDNGLGAMVTPKLPPRLFTDAYFAALAHAANARLVTFDRDFERFETTAMLRLGVNEH